MVRNAVYFFQQAFRGLREHRVMALMTVLTIGLAFLFSGLFFLVYLNLSQYGGKLRGDIRMMVYLHEGLYAEDVESLRKKLEKETGVQKVHFLSKDQAMDEYLNVLNGDPALLEGLGKNPFPASFELFFQPSFQNQAHLRSLAERLERLNQVEEVHYRGTWLDLLNRALQFLKLGGLWLGVLVTSGILAIVSNTIRLTVYARREEIQVLRYLGARDGFIIAPFFIEGLLMGLMGSFFSVLLLILFFELFGQMVGGAFWPGGHLGFVFLPDQVMVSLMGAGMVLGCLGSLISVRGVLRKEL